MEEADSVKAGLPGPSLTARAAVPLLVISVMLTATAIPLSVTWLERQHGDAIPAAAAISVMAVLGTFLFSMYMHLKTFGEHDMAFPRRDRDEEEYFIQLTSPRPNSPRVSIPAVGGRASSLTREVDVLPSDSGTLAERLLGGLDAIECTAQVLIGEGRRISVIRIRMRLLELGIWSERDVCDFDNALKVRNKVARQDAQQPTSAALATAVGTLQHLRCKMLASEHRPRQ